MIFLKKRKIGLIGVGGVAHYGHLVGYEVLDNCEITAICDINEETLKKVGEELNIPENRRFKDYNDIIACEDVEAVDIATWNSEHCKIAKAAALAGKPFSVEKPLGMNYAEALDLAKTVEETGVKSFICLSWRYRAYTRYVKHLVSSGKLGKLYHIYVRCIKDSGLWKGRKREWRFDKNRTSSGVLDDLGSHMIDILHFWGEEFIDVFAQRGIFITERPTEETGEIVPVTTDDWCHMIATLKSGASCTIHVSRTCTTVPDLIEFEVYGEKGKLIFRHKAGVQTIEFVEDGSQEVQLLTPPEEFNAIQSGSFVNLLNDIEDEYTAKIEHGLQCQAVLDAALKSTEENRVVTIKEIKGE